MIELLLAAQTVRDMGFKNLTLVAPYLFHTRQDIAFHGDAAISQRIVGRFLTSLFGALIAVDPHLH